MSLILQWIKCYYQLKRLKVHVNFTEILAKSEGV